VSYYKEINKCTSNTTVL